MVDDKYALKSEIFDVTTEHTWAQKIHTEEERRSWGQPRLQISMSGLYFGEDRGEGHPKDRAALNRAEVGCNGYNIIILYMDKETANANGIDWDGSIDDAKRLDLELRKRRFILNQGLERILVGSKQ